MLRRIILLACASLQTCLAGESSNSLSLVKTELSFARRCQEIGVRASFMEYFAENGVAFKPEPFRYTETVKKLPAQTNPKAIQLEWEPQVAGIAASGELGFTTGPSIRTDLTSPDKPKRYGQFFSVWKKQTDGPWRVAVDIGSQTPALSSQLGHPCAEPMKPQWVQTTDRRSAEDRQASIMKLEQEFTKSCVAEGMAKAYLSRAEDHTRLHRENHLPIVGKAAIEAYLDKESLVSTWSPIGSDVSLADDMGYTYGSYEINKAPGVLAVEKGFYLHLWRKNSEGEWKLVADITNPLENEH